VIPALLLSLVASAPAQYYYEKNKVQTRDYNFKTIATSHFRIYYYDGGEDIAAYTARLAEQFYELISGDLGIQQADLTPIIVYNSPNEFAETNVLTDIIEEGIGGFSELFKNRVVIPFDGSYARFKKVLWHEITHIFEFELFYQPRLANILSLASEYQIPQWVYEGFAEYASGGVELGDEIFMRDLVINNRLLSVDALSDVYGYLSYREGEAIFRYVEDRYGRKKVFELMHELKSRRNVPDAFKETFGESSKRFSEEFEDYLRAKYWPQITRKGTFAQIGRLLTNHIADGSVYNTAPAISPSGTKIAFISDRNEYSDIYVISAVDGKVLKHLVSGERSAGFESVHPYRGGISWSPDETSVVLAGKANGRDCLTIVAYPSGKVLQRLSPDVSGIYSPVFAPDGGSIAFVGLKDGFSDIFVCDLRSGELMRKTADIYEDRDPSFSAGGDTMLFVSDRPDDTVWQPGSYAVFLRTDSAAPTRLTPRAGYLAYPSFLPGGNKIAFVTSDSSYDLCVYELNPGQAENPASVKPARSETLITLKSVLFSSGETTLRPEAYPMLREAVDLLKTNLDILVEVRGHSDSVGSDEHNLRLSTSRARAVMDFLVGAGGIDPRRLTPRGYGSSAPIASNVAEDGRALNRRVDFVVSKGQRAGDGTSESLPVERELPARQSGTVIRRTDFLGGVYYPSFSRDGDRLVLAYYNNLGWDIASIKDPLQTLPERTESLLVAAADTTTYHSVGLDPSRVKRYGFSLTPDYAVGMASYATGAGLSGTLDLALSDALGNHRFYLSTNLIGDILNSDFSLSYWYLRSRIDYGVGLFQQFSNLYYFGTDFFYPDSVLALRDLGVSGLAAYPLNKYARFEFSPTVAAREGALYVHDPENHQYPRDRPSQWYPLFQLDGAYVFDNSYWGAMTAPERGTRFRAEAYGTVFSPWKYATGYVDFRNYLKLAKRYIWANRVVGIASFGPDAEQFSLGGEWVRGYDYGEFADAPSTRMALLSSELRFPFVDRLKIAFPLPLDITDVRGVAFFDAGLATDRWPQIVKNGRWQDLKMGVGAGMRFQISYFLLKLDWGWPLSVLSIPDPVSGKERTRTGIWQFSLGTDF
jgi:outer membrane protein OmpA-like peptidoglycan-associated protein